MPIPCLPKPTNQAFPDTQTTFGHDVFTRWRHGPGRPSTLKEVFDEQVDVLIYFYASSQKEGRPEDLRTAQDLQAQEQLVRQQAGELLALDVIGKAVVRNDPEILEVAASHLPDIKAVQFLSSTNPKKAIELGNLVEFATFAEAQAGLSDLAVNDYAFHSETGPAVMQAVLRIAAQAYGEKEVRQMRLDAFKKHGFATIYCEPDTARLEMDGFVSMDVEFENQVFRLSFACESGCPIEIQENEALEQLAKKVIDRFDLVELDAHEVIGILEEGGSLEFAKQGVKEYLGSPRAKQDAEARAIALGIGGQGHPQPVIRRRAV